MAGSKLTEAEQGFVHGVAWAAAILIRRYDRPVFGLGLLDESGLTFHDLEIAGTAEHDLSPIRAALAAQQKGEGHG